MRNNRGGNSEDPPSFPRQDRFSVFEFLRPFMHDPANMGHLRETLAEQMDPLDLSRLNDHQVLEQLAWRVATGQVKIAALQPVTERGVVELALEEEEEAPAAPPAAAPTEDKTWIRFLVMDDATTKPVEGVQLKIKLPNGTVEEHTTDSGGMVRISDIPEGSCDIEKMIDVKGYEVVDFS